MLDIDYGKIIARNLKRIAYEHDRTQADISRDLDISKTTKGCVYMSLTTRHVQRATKIKGFET